jgi:hypothetical protein
VHLRSVKSLKIDTFLARLLHQITPIPVTADRPRSAVPIGGGTASRFSELIRNRIIIAAYSRQHGPATP